MLCCFFPSALIGSSPPPLALANMLNMWHWVKSLASSGERKVSLRASMLISGPFEARSEIAWLVFLLLLLLPQTPIFDLQCFRFYYDFVMIIAMIMI